MASSNTYRFRGSSTRATAAALLALCLPLQVALAQLPQDVTLENAAQKNMNYPMVGLGTAGGSNDRGYGVYPECWASCADAQCTAPLPNGGCSQYTEAAIMSFFQLGGRRIDSADSYHNQDAVGRAVAAAQLSPLNLARSDIFLQTKVGPNQLMGYQETINQTQQIMRSANVSVLDLVLLHWPDCEHGGGCGPSSDPVCNWLSPTQPAPTYNATACKLSSYKALLDLWVNSTPTAGIRAVGVSNFNITDIQDIQAAGYTLPAVNQISFHLYHSQAEKALIEYCQDLGIRMNGWVPFARADEWSFSPPCSSSPVSDPVASQIATKYIKNGPQIQLSWMLFNGIAVNPRSQHAGHIADMLDIFDVDFSNGDNLSLWGRPQAYCPGPQGNNHACTNPWTAAGACANTAG